MGASTCFSQGVSTKQFDIVLHHGMIAARKGDWDEVRDCKQDC